MRVQRLIRVMIGITCGLILIGIGVFLWVLENKEPANLLKIHLEADRTETIEFESLGILPGESCEYDVSLSAKEISCCRLYLKFVETKEGILKNFARVKVLSGEEVLCDELLLTVFEGKEIVFSIDLEEGKNTELKIIYYLPLEVGNEAKNAEAFFDLELTAKN